MCLLFSADTSQTNEVQRFIKPISLEAAWMKTPSSLPWATTDTRRNCNRIFWSTSNKGLGVFPRRVRARFFLSFTKLHPNNEIAVPLALGMLQKKRCKLTPTDSHCCGFSLETAPFNDCSHPAVRTIWHMAWTETTMGTSRGTIMCIPFVVLH